MSVYENQFQAFQAIHKIVLNTVINKGESMSVEKLIYDITLEVPVSEKVIEKRIQMMAKIEPSIRIKDGLITKDEI